MTSFEFANAVRAIAATNPTYRTGGSGSDGTCDCIGAVIGAVGKVYPMHSTNYFARYEMDSIGAVGKSAQPMVGELVYKNRYGGDELNERYKAGGRYYTGDPSDYYHVGVVVNVEPLEILHCTRTSTVDGFTTDDSLDGWTHIGKLKGVKYEAEEDENTFFATVTAESGGTVRMRAQPGLDSKTMGKIPVGTKVVVYSQTDEWSRIVSGGKSGYMMTKHLTRQKQAQKAEQQAQKNVAVTLSLDTAKEIYAVFSRLFKGGE